MKHTRLFGMALCAALLTGLFAQAEPADGFNLEKRLYELGYCAQIGRISEEQMHDAVADFQIANHLEVTGIADDLTVFAIRSESAIPKSEYLAAFAGEIGGVSVLASGSYGEAVLKLQQALHGLGYFNEACNGSYDATTEFAVSRFQLANGLTETGIADQSVQLRLYMGEPVAWKDFLKENAASLGDTGDTVRMLQIWLKHMGYFSGECTGRYGERTQQAVKRFQNDCGLEITGNVDMETAEQLFADAAKALIAGATVRRGDGGGRALEMCEKLRALGYNAHETFDMQTEFALMRFQYLNALPVTGVADSATMAELRLQSQNGASETSTPADGSVDADLCARALKQAMSLLGEPAEFDDGYDFVRYVYLKCGVLLPEKKDVQPVPQPEGATIPFGCAVLAQTDAGDLWGIAADGGALILSGGEGYIVMRYPDALGVRSLATPNILQ